MTLYELGKTRKEKFSGAMFYRKKILKQDSSLSEGLPDLYDNDNDTIDIEGRPNNSTWFIEGDIPINNIGDGILTDLKLGFYAASTVETASSYPPRLKSFKMKNLLSTASTEGSITLVDTAPIMAVSARLNDSPPHFEEVFSYTGDIVTEGTVTYKVEGGRHYIALDVAYKKLPSDMKEKGLTKEVLKQRFAAKVDGSWMVEVESSMKDDTPGYLDSGAVWWLNHIIPASVMHIDDHYKVWTPSTSNFGAYGDFDWPWWKDSIVNPLGFSNNTMQSKSSGGLWYKETVTTESKYTQEFLPSNSDFVEEVRRAGEIFDSTSEQQSTSDTISEGAYFIQTSTAYDTEFIMTGNASLRLENKWRPRGYGTNYATAQFKWNSDYITGGQHVAECTLIMKALPAPTQLMPTQKTLNDAGVTEYSQGEYPMEINIDFMIDDIAPYFIYSEANERRAITGQKIDESAEVWVTTFTDASTGFFHPGQIVKSKGGTGTGRNGHTGDGGSVAEGDRYGMVLKTTNKISAAGEPETDKIWILSDATDPAVGGTTFFNHTGGEPTNPVVYNVAGTESGTSYSKSRNIYTQVPDLSGDTYCQPADRGIFICFSKNPPAAGEDFSEFVNNHISVGTGAGMSNTSDYADFTMLSIVKNQRDELAFIPLTSITSPVNDTAQEDCPSMNIFSSYSFGKSLQQAVDGQGATTSALEYPLDGEDVNGVLYGTSGGNPVQIFPAQVGTTNTDEICTWTGLGTMGQLSKGVGMGRFLRLQFHAHPDAPGFYFRVLDMESDGEEVDATGNNLLNTDNSIHSKLLNKHWFLDQDVNNATHPMKYISIWTRNTPDLYSGGDAGEKGRYETKCSMVIDNINVRKTDFTQQVSLLEAGRSGSGQMISMAGDVPCLSITEKDLAPMVGTTNGFFNESGYPDYSLTNSLSALAFGFEERSDFEGSIRYLQFHHFNQGLSARSDRVPIKNLWAGSVFTGGRAEDLGKQCLGSSLTWHDGTEATDTGSPAGLDGATNDTGLLIADEDTITIGSSQDAAINIGTGTTGEIMDNYGIDGFSTNGFMRLDYTDNDHHNAVETTTKRECIYASTRIIKINDANGAITVNNTNVLSGDHQSDNDQPTYIIFKTDSGGYASGGTKLTGIKIDYIEDGVVQLAKGTNYASILTVANLPNLRICREKYWLYIVMKMEDADANILNSKKYQTLSLSTDIGTPGATWNEYQFTSGLSYSKGWKDPITMRPKYEQDTDFGYGELDGELGTDGRLSESDGVESGVWNWVDISGAVEHGGSDEGERVSFNVEPLDNFLAETVTVNSVNHSANKPYLLGGFIDELPIISDFKVIPNEDNPYYPEFNWEVSGDDIWYGFLHIDNASILNQYHNAVVHYRLDGLARDEATATAPTEEISGLTTAISGPKYNVEGLAGFCLDFDGVDDYVQCGAGTYPASGSIDVTAECTTEMSVVVHFVANEALDDRYIISQSHENGKEKFSLKLNTSNQVVARVHYAAGANFVELTGSTIVTNDGVGPTCVILTVDTKLKSGNVKLYVNGNLDDMSGEMTVAGSSENWKAGQNINGGISNLFIGHRPVSGSSSFDGKLEEVVIYKSVIYPFGGKETSLLFTKPISELDNSSFTASKSYSAKLFIKDYHNIRGNNYTQVATSSSVSFRKAGFRLDNS